MNLTKANSILKIRGSEFFNEELSCLGSQFAEILTSIKSYTKSHDWYVFDALGTSMLPFYELFPEDSLETNVILSTDELIERVKKVIQFESGVFIAIEKERKVEWDFDYLPETEEDEGIQNPLADIEIRTFDYSYFEIYTMNMEVNEKILNYLKKL